MDLYFNIFIEEMDSDTNFNLPKKRIHLIIMLCAIITLFKNDGRVLAQRDTQYVK